MTRSTLRKGHSHCRNTKTWSWPPCYSAQFKKIVIQSFAFNGETRVKSGVVTLQCYMVCGTKQCKNPMAEPHHENFTYAMSVSLRTKFFRGISMGLTWLQRTVRVSSASSEINEKTLMAFNVTTFWANVSNFENLPLKSTWPPCSSKQTPFTAMFSVQNQCWRQTERHRTKLTKINEKTTAELCMIMYMTSTKCLLYPVLLSPDQLILQALGYITSLFLSPGRAASAKGKNTHISPL